ncbi:MAG: hypothetical protein WBP60_02645, partial [Gammaproteobacteria bacterium]
MSTRMQTLSALVVAFTAVGVTLLPMHDAAARGFGGGGGGFSRGGGGGASFGGFSRGGGGG